MKKTLKRRPGGALTGQCPHPIWGNHHILSIVTFQVDDGPDYYYRLCPDCTAAVVNHLKELCRYEETRPSQVP